MFLIMTFEELHAYHKNYDVKRRRFSSAAKLVHERYVKYVILSLALLLQVGFSLALWGHSSVT